jgi:transcriptional regulator of aromatic amino acid metabolism
LIVLHHRAARQRAHYSATNKNPRELVRQGQMREDFFHRLYVIALEMPPLRQHREDIPLLIRHFRPSAPVLVNNSPSFRRTANAYFGSLTESAYDAPMTHYQSKR